MELSRIKTQLQFAVPEELYKIEPGQIVLYVSFDGIDQRISNNVADFFRYFRKLYKDNNVTLNTVPTNNELLIGHIVGRNPEEVGIPYKIAISDWDTLAGFAAEYFGEDVKAIVERVPSMGVAFRFSISEINLPIIVSLDPNNIKENLPEASDGFDPYGMEAKRAKPQKGSTAEKKLIELLEKKLEKVLREGVLYDITLDVDRIKKKVDDSLKSKIDFKLTLDIDTIKEDSLSFCTTCDIYVAKGEEYKVKLSAAEKAIYLTFLLYENGIKLEETPHNFRRITQKIYNQLPDDDKCEKTAGGIMDKGDVIPGVYISSLASDRFHINAKIDDKITNPLIAQDFIINGFSGDVYQVAQSSPELRAQIKEAFNL